MKNWTGNSKSTFTTLGASNHSDYKRAENDYYATEPLAINKLFDVEGFGTIWEPACGQGHLSKRMIELGKTVYSSDLVDRGYGTGGIDFLTIEKQWSGDIITNPPYKHAQQFVEKSLSLINQGSKVSMFLKLTFLEGQKRKEMFLKYPPKRVLVFSKRIQCARNGDEEMFKKSSASCYAWFIWEKGFTGKPTIDWI